MCNRKRFLLAVEALCDARAMRDAISPFAASRLQRAGSPDAVVLYIVDTDSREACDDRLAFPVSKTAVMMYNLSAFGKATTVRVERNTSGNRFTLVSRPEHDDYRLTVSRTATVARWQQCVDAVRRVSRHLLPTFEYRKAIGHTISCRRESVRCARRRFILTMLAEMEWTPPSLRGIRHDCGAPGPNGINVPNW